MKECRLLACGTFLLTRFLVLRQNPSWCILIRNTHLKACGVTKSHYSWMNKPLNTFQNVTFLCFAALRNNSMHVKNMTLIFISLAMPFRIIKHFVSWFETGFNLENRLWVSKMSLTGINQNLFCHKVAWTVITQEFCLVCYEGENN